MRIAQIGIHHPEQGSLYVYHFFADASLKSE